MIRFLFTLSSILIVFFLFSIHAPAEAQVTNPPRLSLTLQMSGLINPVHITHAGDGSGRLFVVEQPGRIRIVRNGVLQATPFLDISNRVLFGGEQGLLSVAFPPGFTQKGFFYVNYTRNLPPPPAIPDGATIVARYFVTPGNPDVADPNSEQILLTIAQPFANHNGGQLAFSPIDSHLYIGMGDGGSGGDPNNFAQNLNDLPGNQKLLGKLLRIDVETPNCVPYCIPVNNPLLNAVRSEIWALGLRNPFRFSFDRVTGDLYIGDVGQNLFEEIDFQSSTSPGGENYGWDIMEGLSCFNELDFLNPLPTCNQTGLTLPVTQYDHGQGSAVIGGFVYRGTDFPRMQGIYFYGDLSSGRIWGLRNDGLQWQNTLLLVSPQLVSTFGEDEVGNLYMADIAAGQIHILTDQVFLDVPFTHFAHRHVNAIFNNSITRGCLGDNPATPDNEALYCPIDLTTRGQMAALIIRALEGEPQTGPATPTFSDVPVSHPFFRHIERMAALNITLGIGGGLYGPDLNIPREQMAAFIIRALEGNPPGACFAPPFPDVPITNPFCSHIERMKARGVSLGFQDGTFRPSDTVTRDQMAVFLGRAFLGIP